MKIGKKISQIREDNHLTQEEFAEKLCISRQTVSNWETNKCYPDIETLSIISDKFGISLDNLIKEDKDMVRDIDKKVKSYKYTKRFKVTITIMVLVSTLLFWYSYKKVLVYFYRVNPNLSMVSKRIKNRYILADESLANERFKGLNIYIPEALERDEDSEDINEMKFYKDGKLQIWLSKGKQFLVSENEQNERFKHFGFDYKKLMKKYESGSESALVDYYFEHRYEAPNIFWSKSRIQMYYLAANYVDGMSQGGGRIYEISGNRIDGYMYINGKFYVMIFNVDDVSYALRFNSETYAISNVEKLLSGVYIDDLNFGDLAY